jgi:hypothetical protein
MQVSHELNFLLGEVFRTSPQGTFMKRGGEEHLRERKGDELIYVLP